MSSMASTLESLPDDLVLKILVENLSAEDIHDSARLVCRKWYHMTKTPSFAHSHLQHNTNYILIFMNVYGLDKSISMSLRHGRVETSKLRNTLGDWIYICGCNGLWLSNRRRSKDDILNIVNPVTNQDFVLPPIHGSNNWNYTMAYAAVSMVYKVVACSLKRVPNSKWILDYGVLTVGVDKSWRHVCDCDTHFSYETTAATTGKPLVTEGGFLHWCDYGLKDDKVLTMDVETEIIRETPPPYFPQMYLQRRIFLSTGKYLSLLVCCGEYLWEVWEMKPQTGEWRKVSMLSLEAWNGVFEWYENTNIQYLAPIGWLKYPDVLVLGFSGGSNWVFSYNLVTQEMECIQLTRPIKNHTRFIHRSSLVWV